MTYLERDAAVYYGGRVGLVSKGDLMAGLTINSGYSALIYSGGAVNETTVNSSGSVIVSGGVVNSATVNSRGSMFVSDGGKVTGKFNIGSGATVSAYAGSIIDFDISETSAGDPERVNDLSIIQGAPDYTATVIASIISSQQLGQYTLAGGAANFEKTVTLRSEAAGDIAELSLGVTSFNWWRSYTLDSTDSMLSLTVGYIAGTAATATPLNRDGETIRGTDRAARWTSDTEVDADTIFVVDADFGGDAWLDIDGADLSGKVLYGASENYSGAININVGSGKLHNLAAGAAAGSGVANVNLILDDAEVSGAIYAGGFGDVSGKSTLGFWAAHWPRMSMRVLSPARTPIRRRSATYR